MREIAIEATQRTGSGKNASRRVRSVGQIPGVVYGPETKPVAVAVDERAFRSAVKEAGGISAIFNLNISGKSNKVVLRELQRDPVSSKVIHIDFHAIAMNRPINISLPLHFTGEAEGVKNEGGIMQTTLRELDISCLPADIPERFEIDVSELSIGESIHVKDIKIPNVEILSEQNRTVVVISAPTVMKVEEPTAEEAAEAEAATDAEAPAEGEAKTAEGASDDKKDDAKK